MGETVKPRKMVWVVASGTVSGACAQTSADVASQSKTKEGRVNKKPLKRDSSQATTSKHSLTIGAPSGAKDALL
jgi:hypothetical protein